MAERLLGSWHHHIVRRATHPAVMAATAPSRDRNSPDVSRFAGNLTARFVPEGGDERSTPVICGRWCAACHGCITGVAGADHVDACATPGSTGYCWAVFRAGCAST
jgi:hypothetical protein